MPVLCVDCCSCEAVPDDSVLSWGLCISSRLSRISGISVAGVDACGGAREGSGFETASGLDDEASSAICAADVELSSPFAMSSSGGFVQFLISMLARVTRHGGYDVLAFRKWRGGRCVCVGS